jgi:hypothetical protein
VGQNLHVNIFVGLGLEKVFILFPIAQKIFNNKASILQFDVLLGVLKRNLSAFLDG